MLERRTQRRRSAVEAYKWVCECVCVCVSGVTQSFLVSSWRKISTNIPLQNGNIRSESSPSRPPSRTPPPTSLLPFSLLPYTSSHSSGGCRNCSWLQPPAVGGSEWGLGAAPLQSEPGRGASGGHGHLLFPSWRADLHRPGEQEDKHEQDVLSGGNSDATQGLHPSKRWAKDCPN